MSSGSISTTTTSTTRLTSYESTYELSTDEAVSSSTSQLSTHARRDQTSSNPSTTTTTTAVDHEDDTSSIGIVAAIVALGVEALVIGIIVTRIYIGRQTENPQNEPMVLPRIAHQYNLRPRARPEARHNLKQRLSVIGEVYQMRTLNASDESVFNVETYTAAGHGKRD